MINEQDKLVTKENGPRPAGSLALGDIRRAIYWLAAAVITATVTF